MWTRARELSRRISRRHRLLLLAGVTLAAALFTLLLPRIPQNPAYHNFADQRRLFGIPNFLDVVSNVPVLLVGVLGLALLLRVASVGRRFRDRSERWPYLVFFLGVALASFGSTYYHLAPDNARLVWDRLPMTLAFMSFLAAMVSERVSLRTGLVLLPALLALGIGSVFFWHWSELAGRGDLRFYGFVQFYPAVGILLLVVLFPPRYTRTGDLVGIAGLYALAKVFEVLDRQIFSLGGLVSGHTLKHLAAALATYWVLRMLKLRSPAG